MFRIYRKLNKGEFFLVAGDTAQGGSDSNFGGLLSRSRLDFPIIWDFPNRAASEITPMIFDLLNWIYDETGVKPVVSLERQNGGASEMARLDSLNDEKRKFNLYKMKDFTKLEGDKPKELDKLGWDTNTATRPLMIGDLKKAVLANVLVTYDAVQVSHFKTFVTNKRGRPEAAAGKHDDGVMFAAIAWQMYKTEHPPEKPPDDDYEDVYQQDDFTGGL